MTDYIDLEINHNYRKGYEDGFADGFAEAWVPVAEAKPDDGQKVLVYIDVFSGGLIDVGTYRGGAFTGTKWRINHDQVTHWMPLPAPPKEVQDG